MRYTLLTIFVSIFIYAGGIHSTEKACSKGDATACEEMGIRYITGDGVTLNGYMAVRYLSKACDRGLASACNSLAFIYADAEGGVVQSYTKAMKYWKMACRYGDESGCANYKLAQDKLDALRRGYR